MWATDGRAFDVLARGLIADLCFLDERKQELDDVHTVLHSYGKLGVAGPFIALFGNDRSCVAEVASVFAEQFHRLGYVPVERLLDTGEWDLLTAGIQDQSDGRDLRRSEVEASFGPPSLVVDNRVLCYAPADMHGWVSSTASPRTTTSTCQASDATSADETPIPWCAPSAVPPWTSNPA